MTIGECWTCESCGYMGGGDEYRCPDCGRITLVRLPVNLAQKKRLDEAAEQGFRENA